MRLLNFVLLGIAFGILYSCSPLKKIESTKNTALVSYTNGNYEQAFGQLSSLITNYKNANIKVPNDIYLKAAHSAVKISNPNVASDYYLKALNDSVSIEAIKGYLSNNKELNNFNVVDETLNKYASFLENAGEGDYLIKERFDNAIKTDNNQSIVDLFSKLKSSNEEQSMVYLSALEKLNKKKEAVNFCNQLVKENSSYYKAKEWKATYYYKLAEEAYKSRMAEYNKNKNYTAYVYLKRDLKKISANFRIAKATLEDLRKKFPDNKKYIKYLKNTYLRLEMKREAAAMDKLLK